MKLIGWNSGVALNGNVLSAHLEGVLLLREPFAAASDWSLINVNVPV